MMTSRKHSWERTGVRLDLATCRREIDQQRHAVFLPGNGPLVAHSRVVLQTASSNAPGQPLLSFTNPFFCPRFFCPPIFLLIPLSRHYRLIRFGTAIVAGT